MSYIDDKLNQMQLILKEIKRDQALLESKKQEIEKEIKRDQALLESKKQEIEKDFQQKKSELEQAYNINTKHLIDARVNMLNMAKQKSVKMGMPYLADAYDELYLLQEQIHTEYLNNKKRQAPGTAQEIKSFYSARFRASEKQRKTNEYIIKYYENLFPYLKEIREDISDNGKDFEQLNYKEEDKDDPTTFYLTAEEYYKLSENEKSQLALNRYLNRALSKIEIGKMYERYIGYLYEKDGYKVEYKGIVDGIDDLGRDLICKKNDEIVVIQCKNWSQFKTIHEKHIFQFFGTVFEYRDSCNGQDNKLELFNISNTVKGAFFTTTKLSERAKRFATFLNIEIKDNFPMNKAYPMIKCNINQATKERIYHLPFDQQYDRVDIDYSIGECYAGTVKEATDLGFRRAKKWIGSGKN